MNPFYKNRRGASVAKQGNLQDRRNMPRATKEPIGKVNLNALDDFDTSSLDKLSRDIFPAHTELDAYNQLASKLGLGPLNQQEYDELQRTGRRPDPSRPPGPGDPSITANPMSNESKIMNKKLIRLTESDLHRIVKESVQRILNETSLGKLRAARDKASTDIKGYNVLKTFPSAASDKASDSVKGMLPQGWKPPHSGFDKAIGSDSKSKFAGRMSDRRRDQMDNFSDTINTRQNGLKSLPYRYQADFENAIDCLYYGEGKAGWFKNAMEHMSEEDAKNLWKIAVQFMSQDAENDWKRWIRRDWIRGDIFNNKNDGIDFDEF